MSLETELATLTEASKNLAGTVSKVADCVRDDHDDLVTLKERFNTLETKVKDIEAAREREKATADQRHVEEDREARSTSLQIKLAAIGIFVSIILGVAALIWK